MNGARMRTWMTIATAGRAPVLARVLDDPGSREVRAGDAAALGALMDRAYRGTIDDEGESPEQCVAEMRDVIAGKYGPLLDFASFAAFSGAPDGERALSASLVTLWKERPLLAFSMTDPAERGRGRAASLIDRSIRALAERGYPDLFLVVTEGNAPAERLYLRLGFIRVGSALPGTPPPDT